ncbi:MAG: glycosyltransferase family 39 protein [Nitrososphaerales archaeon]
MDKERYSKHIKKFDIGHLIIISLALHLAVIGLPSFQTVHDEKVYVSAAYNILIGVDSNPEHPFLGKLWGSIGIAVFGDNFLGWRIPIVAFGILTLYVFYKLSSLFLDERKALLATAFLSFDTIFFVHSSLLLLEIPALFFGLLAFYLYLKDRYILSAASFGLAILSKEWSLLFVIALLIYHTMIHRPISLKGININKRSTVKAVKFVGVVSAVVVIPLWAFASTFVIFLPLTYGGYEEASAMNIIPVDRDGNPLPTNATSASFGRLMNPLDQVGYIARYQSNLTQRVLLDDDYKLEFSKNYPWGWILPLDVNPVTYFEKEVTFTNELDEEVTKIPLSWKVIGNYPIWLSIWLIAPYALFNVIKKRGNKLDYLIIAWIIATFFSWFFVAGLLGRIVYAFYFINVIPILALGIPYFVGRVSRNNSKLERIITIAWLSAALIFFFYYFPVNVATL